MNSLHRTRAPFRGPKGPVLVMPFIFGILALLRVIGGPRFEQMHIPDVLLLTAGGFNLGIGVAMLIVQLRTRADGQ